MVSFQRISSASLSIHTISGHGKSESEVGQNNGLVSSLVLNREPDRFVSPNSRQAFSLRVPVVSFLFVIISLDVVIFFVIFFFLLIGLLPEDEFDGNPGLGIKECWAYPAHFQMLRRDYRHASENRKYRTIWE